MEERKQRWLKGSFTVEMAFLIPMILFLIMGCIRISFYYHDKNIIAGAAYETAVREVQRGEKRMESARVN